MHRIVSRGYIRDPIHGYILFDKKLEKALIDHELVQRLRHIRQLQLTYLVYPGATHSRFSHSIGVMHLAGRFVDTLLSRLDEEEMGGFSKDSLVESARILGLVHDIGHGPFSHAFDESVLSKHFKNKKDALNHEALGRVIYDWFIKDELRKQFYGTALEGSEEIVSSILNDREGDNILKLIRFAVKDFYYPSDLLDFLVRDSYYTGTVEYGFIDASRLMESSYPIKLDDGSYRVALDRKADGALRGLLQAKVSMFEYVYLHHSNRAYDRLLKKVLQKYAMNLGLVEAVERLLNRDPSMYSRLWDDVVYYKIIHLDEALCPSAGYLKRRYSPWKLEYTPLRIPLIKAVPQHILSNIESHISEVIAEKIKPSSDRIEEFWVEAAEIRPIPATVEDPNGHGDFLFAYKRDTGISIEKISPERLTGILGVIPTLHIRVYVRRDVYATLGKDRVREIIYTASEDVMRELDEAYKISDLMALSMKEELEGHERVTM
ncbi:MAG: HD domain-containing protein [Desulfurococcales archaeon]|nr:HD domain-containing protein [Desulfurococcales archaeon]